MAKHQPQKPAFDPSRLSTDPLKPVQISKKQASLQWSAPVQPIHERTERWYACGMAFLLILIVYGILSHIWTLSFASLAIGFTYYLIRKAPPIVRTISLEHEGVRFENELTVWSACKNFWIFKTPTYNELHITKKKPLQREIIIQTSNIDTTEIVAYISQYITHVPDQKERLVDFCIRFFKL